MVPGLSHITEAFAGGIQSLMLDSSGNVYACGGNGNGQVGDGTTVNRLTVKVVLTGVSKISAGALHSLAAS
jgi:alpha-tubulin suppressor-like RCC1 family protein